MSSSARRPGRWLPVAAAALLLGSVVAGAVSQSGEAGHAALPEISVADAEATHGQTGYATMAFQVTLSAPSTDTVTVDYDTTPGNAELAEDFVHTSGTLSFTPGATSQTIEVTLLPEPGIQLEADEQFTVELSNPVNATIARGTGVGTVHFDGRPPQGRVNVKSVGKGGQCVRLVGGSRCVPLIRERQLKISRIKYIQPRNGIVYLQGKAGQARFRGSPFSLHDTKVGKKHKPALELDLVGGDFSRCPATRRPAAYGNARALAVAEKTQKPVRRLFGHAKGHFRTKGRYSAGTVRGTYWVTTDLCDGTLTHVSVGVVSVHDFVLNKYVLVRAGHSYLASPAEKKKK